MEDLLFGMMTASIEPIVALMSIALIFDFARMLLFSK